MAANEKTTSILFVIFYGAMSSVFLRFNSSCRIKYS